ncbi:MAG: flavodoxin family protein [Bacillota bacterium]
MSGKLCIGLACSPRKGGNTTILLHRAIEALRSANVETEIIQLAEIKYSPCIACEGCNKTGKCVISDGAGPIFEKLLKADILIMAAPVFSMGICAHAKMFIDRAQQFWATKYILKKQVVEDEFRRKSRRGLFISCAGTNLEGVFDGTVRVASYFFKMMDIRLAGAYCYPGIDRKGDILSNAAALKEMEEAALELLNMS